MHHTGFLGAQSHMQNVHQFKSLTQSFQLDKLRSEKIDVLYVEAKRAMETQKPCWGHMKMKVGLVQELAEAYSHNLEEMQP